MKLAMALLIGAFSLTAQAGYRVVDSEVYGEVVPYEQSEAHTCRWMAELKFDEFTPVDLYLTTRSNHFLSDEPHYNKSKRWFHVNTLSPKEVDGKYVVGWTSYRDGIDDLTDGHNRCKNTAQTFRFIVQE